MAIAVAPLVAGKFDIGNKKVRHADVTFTGTYPTGGEAITALQVGLRRIMSVTGMVTEAAGQTTAWNVHWDLANGKLKMFGLAVGATGMTEHGNIAYAASSVGHLRFEGE